MLNDAGYKQWLAFMGKSHPDGDKTDNQTSTVIRPRGF
jgi:hypothetical protein